VAVRYLAIKAYKGVSLMLTLKVDAACDQLSLRTKLVNLQGTYGKVQGGERRKLVTKYLCSRASAAASDFRIALNVETGELKF
jgi:hypothetical protein